MKISEQQFVWCRADLQLEDAQELINFLKPFCKHYFIGHHAKGRTKSKPPHFHFYLTFLKESDNTFRKKFKNKFPNTEICIKWTYNNNDMTENKIRSPAYILAKEYEVPYWTNDTELEWDKIWIEVERIKQYYKTKSEDKNKPTAKEALNSWIKKITNDMPSLIDEALVADSWHLRKILFKKIFSYIMINKIKNEDYVNRNSLNELVYNILLRLSSHTILKKIVDETSEVVYERYFGEGPQIMCCGSGNPISIEEWKEKNQNI